jgi:hypothetical protein
MIHNRQTRKEGRKKNYLESFFLCSKKHIEAFLGFQAGIAKRFLFRGLLPQEQQQQQLHI